MTTTFTWIGGSADFTTPHFWLADGTPTSGIPGAGDAAVIAAAGSYTVSVDSVAVQSLAMDAPGAVLTVAGTLETSGALDNAGRVAIGQPGTAGRLIAGSIDNGGTLVLNDGGSIHVGSYNFNSGSGSGTFDNTGVLSLGLGATLSISAATSTSSLGTIENNGGTLALFGPVANTGQTLSSAGLGFLVVGGPVIGGTLDTTVPLSLNGQSGGVQPAVILDGVTVRGDLAPRHGALITDGIAFVQATPGVRSVIDLGDGGLEFAQGQTFALSGVQIQSAGTDTGGQLIQYKGAFKVAGTLAVSDLTWSGGGLVDFFGLGAVVTPGSLTVTQPLQIRAGIFANSGTITAAGAGGSLTLRSMQGGPVESAINDGMIAAIGGSVTALVDLGGSGTIALGAAGTAELAAGYAGQAFAFLDGTGTLAFDNAAGTVTLTGFAPGATIDLVQTPASVTFNDGTLTALLAGTIPLATFLLPDLPANARFSAVTDGDNNTFITETIACFAGGTRIRAPGGEIPVEWLRAGDRVVSAFGGSVPVVWMGRRRIDARRHAAAAAVRIRAGALAEGVPARDLRLSPDHAVHLDGLLVPAACLVNGVSITCDPPGPETYWHVELPQHDVILAEGAPCESYLDTGNRKDFDNAGPVVGVRPRFTPAELWSAAACAPQCRNGPALDAIRARLNARWRRDARMSVRMAG